MRGEFKDAKKAVGLITARPRRWADRYGLDPNPSKPYRANMFELDAESWDVAYQLLIELYNSKSEIKIIGTRHGEKLYETLVNREDMVKAKDLKDYFRILADNRDLNYEHYFSEGEHLINQLEEYHSHNTSRLDLEGMKNLLLKLPIIRKDILG